MGFGGLGGTWRIFSDLADSVPDHPNIWTDGSRDEDLDAMVGVAGAGAFVKDVPWVFDDPPPFSPPRVSFFFLLPFCVFVFLFFSSFSWREERGEPHPSPPSLPLKKKQNSSAASSEIEHSPC